MAARILPCDTLVERKGGVLYARSPRSLGPYASKLTERLEYWADRAGERAFLCRRGNDGAWQQVTYRSALTRVRSIAQALVDRSLSVERPIVILSGNSLEHALLALASTYVGIPYAPIAPSYSLLARQYTTLRSVMAAMRPGLIFAAEGERYAAAIAAAADPRVEVVTCTPSAGITPFADLEAATPSSRVDTAHASVGPDTIAKVLYTSGSTGIPKGVINTQRMLCSNQEMIRTVMPLLADEAPVLCDWLPWNHTFGGNHNFGIVLYNGGTLYIDDGKPTPDGFATTVANLREVATTAYFNVPRGYDLLVPVLRDDQAFRANFFSRLEMLFCAAAALRQQVADDLGAAAIASKGHAIPFVTGLGATESAPFAICAGDSAFTGGRIGVPVPGVELKLAPVGEKLEGRLRGPNITPGYWRDERLTRDAFDEEGFYKLGDALGFVDPQDPAKGFVFDGRLAEDFKLSTGTWVCVGPLRAGLLAELGDLAHDIVIGGHDRDYVVALVFPNRALAATLGMAEVGERVAGALRRFSRNNPGTSTAIRRAMLLEDPPAIDTQELTEKGSVNQKAVLANRAALVERLFSAAGIGIIDIEEGRPLGNTPH